MECVYCVNCGSASSSMVLEDEQILLCIQQWTAPRLVQAHDLICIACWTLAQENNHASTTSNVGRSCVLCNRTLEARTRSYQLLSLRRDTPHHLSIKNIVIEKLAPLEMRASHYICHPCWQRADRAAVHNSKPSSSRSTPRTKSNPIKCANCGIHLIRQRRHILYDNAILLQIQQQVEPQVVSENDYICDACHTLFVDRNLTTTPQDSQDTTTVGHHHVCLGCGCSLIRTRRHSLGAESNIHILGVVQNWIHPREIHPAGALCHRCFQRAETAANNSILPELEVFVQSKFPILNPKFHSMLQE